MSQLNCKCFPRVILSTSDNSMIFSMMNPLYLYHIPITPIIQYSFLLCVSVYKLYKIIFLAQLQILSKISCNNLILYDIKLFSFSFCNNRWSWGAYHAYNDIKDRGGQPADYVLSNTISCNNNNKANTLSNFIKYTSSKKTSFLFIRI